MHVKHPPILVWLNPVITGVIESGFDAHPGSATFRKVILKITPAGHAAGVFSPKGKPMAKVTACALTNEAGQVIGFTDHTGYFYPVDRGQISPGQFHCDIPLSALELGELVFRLDELVKAARALNASLDVSRCPEWIQLKNRVSSIEEKLERAALSLLGQEYED